jgi:integrase
MPRSRRGRGEGGVYQRSDGLWVGSLSLGQTGSGKRKRRTVYGKTKNAVLAKLDSLRGKVRAGSLADTGKLTVGQVLDLWLASLKSRSDAKTYQSRETSVRVHLRPRVGGTRIDRLSAIHVEALAVELADDKVGPGAARAALDVLDSALSFAAKRDLIPSNPFRKVDKPRPKKREPLFLTVGQARAVRECPARPPTHALVVTALGTGLRSGELLALQWPDVDLDAATLTVRRALSPTKDDPKRIKEPKSKASRRTVGLPPFVVKALRELRVYRDRLEIQSDYVFVTRSGELLDRGNVLKAWRKLVGRVNDQLTKRQLPLIPAAIRFHDLRHSHASILLSEGHSLKAVSRRLGHASAVITLSTYSHVMPDDDSKLTTGIGALLG